jgi:hypothetical protein
MKCFGSKERSFLNGLGGAMMTKKGSYNRHLQIEKLLFGSPTHQFFWFFVQHKMKDPVSEMV